MILNLKELKGKYSMNINGIIHIGAHFGEEHYTYKNLGIDNIVYFEPVKKTFDILKNKIKDAKVFNYALGSENKKIEMFIEQEDIYGCSSILEPSSNYSNVIFSEKELVEMKRLDDFNFAGYNFLNIDVQGYEYEVLKGSEKTLENIDYIICEINRDTVYKKMDYIGASVVGDIISFLKKYGFELVEQNWAGISWGDGFFIKNK